MIYGSTGHATIFLSRIFSRFSGVLFCIVFTEGHLVQIVPQPKQLSCEAAGYRTTVMLRWSYHNTVADTFAMAIERKLTTFLYQSYVQCNLRWWRVQTMWSTIIILWLVTFFNVISSYLVVCALKILLSGFRGLTHSGRDKMVAIFQTTFSNSFSWMKMYQFRSKFHWSLFLRVRLTISQHWFR